MAESKKKTACVVVDDGTEEVEIRNQRGDKIGVLVFRPADMGIIDRWNEMAKDFDRIIEPLEKADINQDGTANESDVRGIEALEEASRRLCEALDRAFDGNVSEAFFGGRHPFAIASGGRFYCENVLDAVAGFMADRFKAGFERINRRQDERMGAYTHGVRTGRHAGGRK